MNPAKERVLAALAHRRPDRIPVYDSFWGETAERYRKELDELGKGGIEQIVELDLTAEEKQLLYDSAEGIKELIKQMGLK